MKQYFLTICLLLFALAIYAGEPVIKNKVVCSYSYTSHENLSAREFWLTKTCFGNSENIIKTPKSAAILAYIYAQNLYGEDVAKKEQPYQIQLVNDSIWCVNGTSRKYNGKKWKGSFVIAIDKKTGKLLAHMHEK